MDSSSSSITHQFQLKYSLQIFHNISPAFAALHTARLRRLRRAHHGDDDPAAEPSTSSTLHSPTPELQIPLQCPHCGLLGAMATRLVRTRSTKRERLILQSKKPAVTNKEGQITRAARRCIRRQCAVCGHSDDQLVPLAQDRLSQFPVTSSKTYKTTSPPTHSPSHVDDTVTGPVPTGTPHPPASKLQSDGQSIATSAPNSNSPSIGKSLQNDNSIRSVRKSTKGKKTGLQEMLQRAREKKASESKTSVGLAGFLEGL